MKAEELREEAIKSAIAHINIKIDSAIYYGHASAKANIPVGILPEIRVAFRDEGFGVEVSEKSYKNIYEGFWIWKRKVGIRYLPDEDGDIEIVISWGGKDE